MIEHAEHNKDLVVATSDQIIEHYKALHEKFSNMEQKIKDTKDHIESVINGEVALDSKELHKCLKDSYKLLVRPFVHQKDDL